MGLPVIEHGIVPLPGASPLHDQAFMSLLMVVVAAYGLAECLGLVYIANRAQEVEYLFGQTPLPAALFLLWRKFNDHRS